MNVAGETAKYQYHGLGHRVGKEISLDPTKQLSGQSQKPDSRIDYLIDLTREYHNLLEKQKMALARLTSGMEMWQLLKKAEREATICRMS